MLSALPLRICPFHAERAGGAAAQAGEQRHGRGRRGDPVGLALREQEGRLVGERLVRADVDVTVTAASLTEVDAVRE